MGAYKHFTIPLNDCLELIYIEDGFKAIRLQFINSPEESIDMGEETAKKLLKLLQELI